MVRPVDYFVEQKFLYRTKTLRIASWFLMIQKKRYTPEAIIHKLREVEILPVLKEAEVIIEHWQNHCNTKRPHSALGYRPPAPEVVLPREITDELEKGQKAA
jgi:transposase InsO family protein